MESTIVYIGGNIRIMEKKMETAGVYRGLLRDAGKENGNCYDGNSRGT